MSAGREPRPAGSASSAVRAARGVGCQPDPSPAQRPASDARQLATFVAGATLMRSRSQGRVPFRMHISPASPEPTSELPRLNTAPLVHSGRLSCSPSSSASTEDLPLLPLSSPPSSPLFPSRVSADAAPLPGAVRPASARPLSTREPSTGVVGMRPSSARPREYGPRRRGASLPFAGEAVKEEQADGGVAVPKGVSGHWRQTSQQQEAARFRRASHPHHLALQHPGCTAPHVRSGGAEAMGGGRADEASSSGRAVTTPLRPASARAMYLQTKERCALPNKGVDVPVPSATSGCARPFSARPSSTQRHTNLYGEADARVLFLAEEKLRRYSKPRSRQGSVGMPAPADGVVRTSPGGPRSPPVSSPLATSTTPKRTPVLQSKPPRAAESGRLKRRIQHQKSAPITSQAGSTHPPSSLTCHTETVQPVASTSATTCTPATFTSVNDECLRVGHHDEAAPRCVVSGALLDETSEPLVGDSVLGARCSDVIQQYHHQPHPDHLANQVRDVEKGGGSPHKLSVPWRRAEIADIVGEEEISVRGSIDLLGVNDYESTSVATSMEEDVCLPSVRVQEVDENREVSPERCPFIPISSSCTRLRTSVDADLEGEKDDNDDEGYIDRQAPVDAGNMNLPPKRSISSPLAPLGMRLRPEYTTSGCAREELTGEASTPDSDGPPQLKDSTWSSDGGRDGVIEVVISAERMDNQLQLQRNHQGSSSKATKTAPWNDMEQGPAPQPNVLAVVSSRSSPDSSGISPRRSQSALEDECALLSSPAKVEPSEAGVAAREPSRSSMLRTRELEGGGGVDLVEPSNLRHRDSAGNGPIPKPDPHESHTPRQLTRLETDVQVSDDACPNASRFAKNAHSPRDEHQEGTLKIPQVDVLEFSIEDDAINFNRLEVAPLPDPSPTNRSGNADIPAGLETPALPVDAEHCADNRIGTSSPAIDSSRFLESSSKQQQQEHPDPCESSAEEAAVDNPIATKLQADSRFLAPPDCLMPCTFSTSNPGPTQAAVLIPSDQNAAADHETCNPLLQHAMSGLPVPGQQQGMVVQKRKHQGVGCVSQSSLEDTTSSIDPQTSSLSFSADQISVHPDPVEVDTRCSSHSHGVDDVLASPILDPNPTEQEGHRPGPFSLETDLAMNHEECASPQPELSYEDTILANTKYNTPLRLLTRLVHWTKKNFVVRSAKLVYELRVDDFVRADLPLTHPTHPGGVIMTYKDPTNVLKLRRDPVTLYNRHEKDVDIYDHLVPLMDLYHSKCPPRVHSTQLFLAPLEEEPAEGWEKASIWFQDINRSVIDVEGDLSLASKDLDPETRPDDGAPKNMALLQVPAKNASGCQGPDNSQYKALSSHAQCLNMC